MLQKLLFPRSNVVVMTSTAIVTTLEIHPPHPQLFLATCMQLYTEGVIS